MEEFMKKFNDSPNIAGKLIEETRLKKNMTKEELIKKLELKGINIDRTQLYRMEKSLMIIKDFELIAICGVLNISMEELTKLIDQ